MGLGVAEKPKNSAKERDSIVNEFIAALGSVQSVVLPGRRDDQQMVRLQFLLVKPVCILLFMPYLFTASTQFRFVAVISNAAPSPSDCDHNTTHTPLIYF